MTDNDIQIKSSQTSLVSSTALASINGISSEILPAKPLFSEHALINENLEVMRAIETFRNEALRPSLTTDKSVLLGTTSIEERLFDARTNVKIMTSEVSMHIRSDLRKKLFRQIDMLHDPDEWEPDDIPISESSFKAFLSGFLQINPERGPGLGLSHAGNLIASWVSSGRDRLIIEFMPNSVKWVITRFINDETEQFTGRTKINRLFESLVPYDPEHWFSKKEKSDVPI